MLGGGGGLELFAKLSMQRTASLLSLLHTAKRLPGFSTGQKIGIGRHKVTVDDRSTTNILHFSTKPLLSPLSYLCWGVVLS